MMSIFPFLRGLSKTRHSRPLRANTPATGAPGSSGLGSEEMEQGGGMTGPALPGSAPPLRGRAPCEQAEVPRRPRCGGPGYVRGVKGEGTPNATAGAP